MPEQLNPRFSVVIPCHNEESHVPDALISLQNQDFTGEFEVVVVDNNSTDKTAEVAQKAGARIIREHRPGVCWARQAGTEAARGEIIVSTDADSTFAPDWLSKIDEAFRKNDKIVAVTGPFHYDGGPKWGAYAKLVFRWVAFYYRLTGRIAYAPGTNFAFKKAAWDGYNTLMTQYGDEIDLLRKLRRKGKVVFDENLIVLTSPRRLRRGFLYNAVFSFFLYSFVEYNLNRLFRRRFFGQAPAFRDAPGSNAKTKGQLN